MAKPEDNAETIQVTTPSASSSRRQHLQTETQMTRKIDNSDDNTK
jgi:hypothetical protein